jgi:alpha-tubulin suppressor-like RCC1 family protein
MKTHLQHFAIAAVLFASALVSGRAEAKDVQVTAGDYFTCAWIKNEVAKCWGLNTQGQLGQGDTNSRGDAAGEMGDALLPIDLGTF